MGYKLDWTDEEILQYALGKLDVSEYEIDGMKYFLEKGAQHILSLQINKKSLF